MSGISSKQHSYFICNEFGYIREVLKDELNILYRNILPFRFLELFEDVDLLRAREFWSGLLANNNASISDIRLTSNSSAQKVNHVSGTVADGDILIGISSGVFEHINQGLERSGTDFSLTTTPDLNSDEPDNSRDLIARDEIILNDLSLLNNELINLQRKMMKQNAVIANLSKQLETNDQKFQLLSRAINDAIWDWSITDDTIQWNQRLLVIYGYGEKEAPKNLDSWASNIHPDDRAEALATLQETLRHGTLNWKFLYRYKTVSGTYKYTFDRGFIVYVGNQAVRMISVMQDIDDRMASLQEIEKLSLVASKTDNLVIITDDQEKIEWVNEGFIKRTGYTLNEVLGKTPEFMQGPETDRATLDIIRQHVNAKQSVTQEVLNYTKDGSKFWVKVNINPVFDDRNNLVKFVAVETDVTPHKEYENKITAIATDLTNLIATVNAPVFGIDKDGCINEWNNLASELTGYTKTEVLGKRLIETMVDEPFRAQVLAKLLSVFRGNPLSNLELPIVSKNGNKIVILINATPRKDTHNNVNSVFLVGQDITELTEYRHSLEQEVKERTQELETALKKERELVTIKTRFASMVSHEFRTPLSTIKLSANYIKKYRERLQPHEMNLKLDTIHDQVLHMTHMLEDVLTIGKSDAGKIELNKTRLYADDFLHSIKTDVENQYKNSHIVHLSLAISSNEIYSDADLLRNIFVNLLSNAIKFSPGKSDVYLNAHEEADTVIFEIVDHGIGIASADADRIFNPFDRGSNTTSISGTGLGLAIVKKAVDLMNGNISFKSTALGTRFVVTFPKSEIYG
jgi:PAS domain S-box-containing protein